MQSGDQIHQVRQATDIVELIGQQIRIQPKGREFVALCPFHDDSNPSMTVSPTKQIYKCFACGAGGGAFDWMINYHKMTFPEALRFLAERAGITLERRGRESGDQPNDRQRMSEATEHALGWFRATLGRPQGATARAYVEQRGISPEMVEQFQLGCAPDAWDDLAQDVAANRWDPRSFRSAGLIHGRQSGSGDIDRFRHRLMFPIFDGLGRPIAFGGRILPRQTPSDREEAKYLNSPESALFNKSATLYGLHLARNEIGKRRCAVIVEGYTDVIACHQHGLSHVVATLGTALTTQHVGVLRRFSEKVVLVFDADEAGQKAADRAVEVFLGGELDVAVSILPDGLDPASLLEQADGAARFEALLSEATDALDYQFQRVADEYRGASTMAGQHRIAEQYVDRL
ncbi:MAG: DNA primase, partial [Phycisphaeraceae bacterium]|nr:DNA primase [Phycisphaeraceae bacterium]